MAMEEFSLIYFIFSLYRIFGSIFLSLWIINWLISEAKWWLYFLISSSSIQFVGFWDRPERSELNLNASKNEA
jgi:hypothetical protein